MTINEIHKEALVAISEEQFNATVAMTKKFGNEVAINPKIVADWFSEDRDVVFPYQFFRTSFRIAEGTSAYLTPSVETIEEAKKIRATKIYALPAHTQF